MASGIAAPGDSAESEIYNGADDQQPHRGEVPPQGAGQPAAERDLAWKCEIEKRRGVLVAVVAVG